MVAKFDALFVAMAVLVVSILGRLDVLDEFVFERLSSCNGTPHKVQEGWNGLEFHQMFHSGWIGIGYDSPFP